MPRIAQPKPREGVRLVSTDPPRYYAVVSVQRAGGSRRQETKTFSSLPEARAWRRDIQARVSRGEYLSTNRTTLDGLVAEWLDSRANVRTVTVRGYRLVMRTVLDVVAGGQRFGDRQVQRTTPADITAALTVLADGGPRFPGDGDHRPASRRTVTYSLTTLRMIFRYGVREKIIATSPAQYAEAPRISGIDQETPATWTPEDLARFVAAADTTDRAYVWRLAACGLRRSELLGLRWSSIDLSAGKVMVERSRIRYGGRSVDDEPKSKRSRRTLLPDEVWPGSRALLRAAYVAQGQPEDGYVVLDRYGGPLDPQAVSAEFHRVAAAAGLPRIRLHAIRHSLATAMHRAGAAPADAAAFLGHSTEVHLARYVVSDGRGMESTQRNLGLILAGRDRLRTGSE